MACMTPKEGLLFSGVASVGEPPLLKDIKLKDIPAKDNAKEIGNPETMLYPLSSRTFATMNHTLIHDTEFNLAWTGDSCE
jgi:hypothetical protein